MPTAPRNIIAPHLPTPSPTISNTSIPDDAPPIGPLNASKDARQVVRLVQCPQCSLHLREPVTLPCGNTLCKKCIPELHLRANISYPATASRLRGFRCLFERCGKEHAEGDYGVDVVLSKVIYQIRTEIDAHRKSSGASEALIQAEVMDQVETTSLYDGPEQIRVSPGGRLLAAYNIVEEGKLAYDVEGTPTLDVSTEMERSDAILLERLRESTRPEVDCQVCYAVLLDPLTANCGHTLCRKCTHRVLDHSHLCPTCRQPMQLLPGASARQFPANALLTSWISGLFHQDLTSRIHAEKLDGLDGTTESDTPLFVCAISFLHMPTFLHIFEPKYRLMIRRVIENGTRKFGMLLYNPTREPQGDLGKVPFYEYGTMLEVVNMQLLPDGRSLLETVGVSRFRVLRHSMLDGYTVGKIERVNDISITEEEAIEVAETSPGSKEASSQDHIELSFHATSFGGDTGRVPTQDLNSLPTQELLDMGTSYIKKMQEQSAYWLHRSIVNAYGDCPSDAALFPWWFASVVPASNAEKYRMLRTSSVRQRLKMCVGWVQQLEAQRWGSGSSCTVS